jgi:hypothetical protein
MVKKPPFLRVMQSRGRTQNTRKPGVTDAQMQPASLNPKVQQAGFFRQTAIEAAIQAAIETVIEAEKSRSKERGEKLTRRRGDARKERNRM